MAFYSLVVFGVNSSDRSVGWREVERLKGDKPVLVVGAPRNPLSHPCGDVTIDIDPKVLEGCLGGQLADIRAIPYGNKYFSVAFASHVIEHLRTVDDAKKAMSELRRVADHIVIVSPRWFDFINIIHPDHYLFVEPEGVIVDSQIFVQPRKRDLDKVSIKVAI